MNHAPLYSRPPGLVEIRIFLIAEGIVRNDIDQFASSFLTFQRDKISWGEQTRLYQSLIWHFFDSGILIFFYPFGDCGHLHWDCPDPNFEAERFCRSRRRLHFWQQVQEERREMRKFAIFYKSSYKGITYGKANF